MYHLLLHIFIFFIVGSESSFEVPVTIETGGECIEFGLTDTIGTVSTSFKIKYVLLMARREFSKGTKVLSGHIGVILTVTLSGIFALGP